MGYWIPINGNERIFCSNLKDAYTDAAKILLNLYRETNGNIHKIIKGYHDSDGIPIYNSAHGKSCNHWVRFADGSNPKDGYEECVYDKRIGMNPKHKLFPKSWM